MQAVVMSARGRPEVLRPAVLSDPEPAAGEVRVRVRAVALNHLDVWVRKGAASPELPLPYVQTGALRPVVGRVLPLAEAARGHALLEDRAVFGKVVLSVGNDHK